MLFDCLFSSFWRSPCRSSGHNPPKERQPNINFIIHNLALPLNKLNFQFNCWLPSLFPRFVEISFFNFKRRLGPHCPSTIKSNHSAHSEERNEIDLCVEWAAAAVSIAIPFIIPFKNSKFFHSMNMQQLYWRQITVIILFDSFHFIHEFTKWKKTKRMVELFLFELNELNEMNGWPAAP